MFINLQLTDANQTGLVLGEYTVEVDAVPRIGDVLYLQELAERPESEPNCWMVAEVSHVFRKGSQFGKLQVHVTASQCLNPERASTEEFQNRVAVPFSGDWTNER
jgi:hypothetical protein